MFDNLYGLRSEDIVHIQTFRATVILLLAHYNRDQKYLPVTKDEVNICARALRSAAKFHLSARVMLEVFDELADSFGYMTGAEPRANPEPSSVIIKKEPLSTPRSTEMDIQSPNEYFSPPAPLPTPQPQLQRQWHYPQQHPSTVSQQPMLFAPHYTPASTSNLTANWPPPPIEPQITMGNDFGTANFGNLVGQGLQQGLQQPAAASDQTSPSMGDLQFDWETMQQALQFDESAASASAPTAASVCQNGEGTAETEGTYWRF
jgi:hypothetical protein